MSALSIFRRPSSLIPFDETDRMFDRLARMWGNGGNLPSIELTGEYPVDITEDDKNVYVDAEMPGFTKDQVNISIEQGMLNITAERKSEKKEEKKGREHLNERRFTRIERSFTIPASVDENRVDAKLENGVLRVVLQKSPQAVAHKIAVK